MRRREVVFGELWRLGCVIAIVVAGVGAPRAAQASSSGIKGWSGKQGFNCSSFCHGGGVAPRVSFTAPPIVPPGATVQIRFNVISQAPGQQVEAGFNVAATGGVLDVLPDPGGAWKLADELTHDSPKLNDAAGVAFWDFTWTAPEESGPYLLYGAGNSVDDSEDPNGDLAATAILTLQVRDEPSPAPAPAASLPGLIAIVVVLVACGGLAIRRQLQTVG